MIKHKEENILKAYSAIGLRSVVLILFVIGGFTPNNILAQNPLQDGFDLLDAQKYTEAELFFENYFEVHDKTARICHARAVGLGGRSVEALDYLKALDKKYPNDTEIELNIGEAYMWNKEPQLALEVYESVLGKEPDNFVATLGYAHAHASMQKNEVALEYINKALAINENDHTALNSKNHISLARAFELYKQGQYSEAKELLGSISEWEEGATKVNELNQQVIAAGKKHVFGEYKYAYDADDNKTKLYSVGVDIPVANRHRFSLRGSIQESYVLENNVADIQKLGISDRFIMSEKIYLHFGADYLTIRSNEVQSSLFFTNAAVELFPSQRVYAKLSYSSELFNYGVDLINQEVLANHISGAFNLLITPKLGLYSNGIITTQSDGNIRRLSYNSLYFMVTQNPTVKIGVSHSYISFLERNIFYFSPESYHLLEGFMRIDNDTTQSTIKYAFQASFGSERINGSGPRATTRIEGKLGYNFKGGLSVEGSYLAANAASTNILGLFSYNEIKLRLHYRF